MRRLLVSFVVLSLALAACGGGGDDATNTPAGATPSTPRGTATTTGNPTATAGQATTAAGTPTSKPTGGTATVATTPGSGGTPSPVAHASPTKRPATSVSTPRPIVTATSRPHATATTSSQPTATTDEDATPTATVPIVITPGGDGSVELVDVGFGQVPDTDEVGYGFVVHNTDTSTALDYTEYEIVAYDAAGTALESDTGYIDLLLPGETRGVGGSIYVPDNTTAARVEVQITAGDPTTSDFPQAFTSSKVTYYDADFFPRVSALISSPYDQPVQDLDMEAVLYDASGKIIGGGYGFLDFVLPDQPAGAAAYVASNAAPARVDIYVSASSVTSFIGDPDAPGDQPTVVTSGWGVSSDGFDVGYGLIVKNPNSDVVIDSLRYQVVAFDANGTVLEVDSSYISAIFPDEQFGIGGSMYLSDNTVVDHLDFQILAVNFIATSVTNPLTVSDATYVDDEFSPSVTGTVASSWDSDLENVEVYAITYDADGNINGGGFTYIDLVAAGGTADAEVDVTTSDTPTTVELYTTVSSLLDVMP